jgi:hypothetical protein
LKTVILLFKYRCVGWLRDYFAKQRRNNQSFDGDTHVMLLLCDHFEPSRPRGDKGVKEVADWCREYAEACKDYSDDDGRYPQHSWFMAYDYPNFDTLQLLSSSVYEGYGEVEFHLHHGWDLPDDFSRTLDEGTRWFQTAGAMLTAEEHPKRAFAYIAGNWALDNGRRKDCYSGCNREVDLLSQYNCYSDFTFPAVSVSSQPATVNNIYYATDDGAAKSYNHGVELQVGKPESGDLMIFQGPIYIDWKAARIETAAFETFMPFDERRTEYWLRANVHIPGRPEWKFIKLHTHGMQSMEIFKRGKLVEFFAGIKRAYQKPGYVLHYVSAREAYNIAKAAEAGMKGNPNHYRDYLIKPPANSKIRCNTAWKLNGYTEESVSISILSPVAALEIDLKHSIFAKISAGYISEVKLIVGSGEISACWTGSGSIELHLVGGGVICFEKSGSSMVSAPSI